MLLGYTYDKQLFTSEAFRKFEDTFINGNSGVLSGMEVTVTDTTATISDGWALIKGGLLREQGSSVVNLSSNGYYIVALQINLSETNTETEFNQGSFVALRGTSAYPTLTQEDLTNGGTIYQMGLVKFRKTDSGISDIVDIRVFLNWNSMYAEFENALDGIRDLSDVVTTDGNKTITGPITFEDRVSAERGIWGWCSYATEATKMQYARKINNTNFDGTQDVTTAKWGQSRNIALSGAVSGNANVDGSGNVTISTSINRGTGNPSGGSNGDVYIQYF